MCLTNSLGNMESWIQGQCLKMGKKLFGDLAILTVLLILFGISIPIRIEIEKHNFYINCNKISFKKHTYHVFIL